MPEDFELKKIKKGTKHSIKKEYGLSKIGIGLGWKANPINKEDVIGFRFQFFTDMYT